MHACLHTYIPTYLPTYLPTHLHTYLPTYLHTCIPTYLHTYLPTYPPTHPPTYLPTYLITYVHTCMHACMQIYRYACFPAGFWNTAPKVIASSRFRSFKIFEREGSEHFALSHRSLQGTHWGRGQGRKQMQNPSENWRKANRFRFKFSAFPWDKRHWRGM